MEHLIESTLQMLSDQRLLDRLTALTQQSCRTEAELVAHIGEVDRRRLYAREACSSMFAYCTERLHLSEPEAYFRITAARAAREHPPLLEMLADGRLHLSAIALLAPHLTADNRDDLLARAVHRSKRQVAELVAELSPAPDVAGTIRKLPGPANTNGRDSRCAARSEQEALSIPSVELCPDGVAAARPPAATRAPAGVGPTVTQPAAPPFAARPATVEPIAPARYKVVFTASTELRDKLERLRDLMRSSVPDGDLAALIEQAVTEKLERLEARRFAKTARPRKALTDTEAAASSRHVPAPIRRAVHERDAGRCAFVDRKGRRCTARVNLEFHHRRPYGYGGDHSVGNLGLFCRVPNRYLARIDYGPAALGRARGGAGPRANADSVRTESASETRSQ